MTPNSVVGSEPVGNVVALEHVNVGIGDQGLALHFYVDGLGFVRDKEYSTGLENMWLNLGPTQFHLPTGMPQVVRGHVGVVVPDQHALVERLEEVGSDFVGTAFGFSEAASFVEVTTPWGNRLRCFEADPFTAGLNAGIGYVEFEVPLGSAPGIAAFYREILDTPAALEEVGGKWLARCAVGAHQSFVFRETSNEIAPYDGHHVQIYVTDIATPREKLRARGLVYEDHDPNQFRFKDIIDLGTGAVLYEIEHEVRSTAHPMFGRL
jgi:catechol 2,3-dioxygenase-like lactoylglutathione lyase family enzyme